MHYSCLLYHNFIGKDRIYTKSYSYTCLIKYMIFIKNLYRRVL